MPSHRSVPSRQSLRVTRACAIDNGTLTFPDEIPGVGKVEGRWVGLGNDYQSDVEWESDDDDDETRWLTVRGNGWESGHERCMNPGQEGWLPRAE